MKIYILFEGPHSNDDEMTTTFYKLDRALKAFSKSKYAHVLLNEYEGTKEDPMENYRGTIDEKGTK